MPRQPVAFELRGLPLPRAAEAAARRRLRTLEMAYPGVLAWRVQVEACAPGAAPAAGYLAHVQARIAGGATLQGEERAADPLAALRLAFNALELELEQELEGARHRAAQWLHAVRSRMGQLQGMF